MSTITQEPIKETKGTLKSLQVLIVDDEPSLRHVYSRFVTMKGHSVTTAVDGADAMRVMETRDRYDIVITDLRMPNLDGLSLIRRIKETYGENSPAMLLGSGMFSYDPKQEDRIKDEAIRAGALVYTKPVTRAMFDEMLDQLVEKCYKNQINASRSG